MSTPSINISSDDFEGYDQLEPLTPLLRHVMPIVPQLPHSMALDMLRQKFIDFSRRTRILQTRVKMHYQSGVRDYQLCAPEGYYIYAIMGIKAEKMPNPWYWYGGYGHYRHHLAYDVIDNNIIRLHHEPSTDRPEGLKVDVVLLPDHDVMAAPASVLGPYGYALASGVTAAALLIPEKPWTNPALSRDYKQEYERAILNGRALASNNRKVGASDMQPVRIC